MPRPGRTYTRAARSDRPARGVGEPAPEGGDGGDQRDRPLAGPPLESELEAVAVVGDIPDGQLADLAATRARIPRDGDEGGVVGVPRGLDHREDVFFPVEHVAGIRRGS